MSYPLHAELYTIDGAIYRRPPYRGAKKETVAYGLPTGGGDTADLYDDDEDAGDDGPACGFDAGSVADYGEVATDTVADERQTSRQKGKAPRDAKAAKISTAPPPGFPNGSGYRGGSSEGGGGAPADPRVTFADGKWQASMSVACSAHGGIIGYRWSNHRQLEEATQCRVKMPEKGSKSEIIKISSIVGAENVSRCIDRIEATVLKNQSKGGGAHNLRPTHFAAIPLVDGTASSVAAGFCAFRESMLVDDKVHPSCRHAELFPHAAKLHLTICMLNASTAADTEKLLTTLQQVEEDERKRNPRPFQLRIRGLDIMNDDPANVHVLFAKVQGDGVQQMVNRVRDAFVASGCVVKADRNDVKLHMTVLNSRYMADSFEMRDRAAFDATALMREYADYDFGTLTLDRITICCLSTEDKATGYYEIMAEARFD